MGPALTVVAYLLGSISFGLIMASRRGVDLRAVGSGNVGATNVGRALGQRTGAIVLLLDGLKGLLPVLAVRWLVPGDPRWMSAAGLAAVVGHLFPIWHGLRGGKGVATTAGVMLAAVPIAGAAMAIVYVALRKTTKRSSVGSLVGMFVALVITAGIERGSPQLWMATTIAALVVVHHEDNIRRLWRGNEPPS